MRYETEYVTESRMRELQNECEVHVIPSQAEGYGHVIGEAMACGAVVVTTDAPPMNELVTLDRGVLIRVARSEPMRRSMKSYVDITDLEAKLNQVFAMSPTRRAEMGLRARAWFEAQHARFENSLGVFLNELHRSIAAK